MEKVWDAIASKRPNIDIEQRDVRKKLVESRSYFKTKMDNDIKSPTEKKDERKLKHLKMTIDPNVRFKHAWEYSI